MKLRVTISLPQEGAERRRRAEISVVQEEYRCRGRGVYAMRKKIATTKFGGRAAFILQKNLCQTYNIRLEALRTSRSAQNLLRRVRMVCEPWPCFTNRRLVSFWPCYTNREPMQ